MCDLIDLSSYKSEKDIDEETHSAGLTDSVIIHLPNWWSMLTLQLQLDMSDCLSQQFSCVTSTIATGFNWNCALRDCMKTKKLFEVDWEDFGFNVTISFGSCGRKQL